MRLDFQRRAIIVLSSFIQSPHHGHVLPETGSSRDHALNARDGADQRDLEIVSQAIYLIDCYRRQWLIEQTLLVSLTSGKSCISNYRSKEVGECIYRNRKAGSERKAAVTMLRLQRVAS